MTVRISTSLAEAVAAAYKSALDGGFIAIFSGPVPATADAAIDMASDLLVTISIDGLGSTGLTFTDAGGGVLVKNAGETWKGTSSTSGTATFYRFYESGDDPSASSSSTVRFQGTVGTTPYGYDLVLPSTTIGSSVEVPIAGFTVTCPLVGC